MVLPRLWNPVAMLVRHQPRTLDFTIATLDAPEGTAPALHICNRSRIPWFDTADDLPRHERFRPETVGLTPQIEAGAPVMPPSAL